MEWFSRNRILLIGTGLSILSVVVHFLAANQTEHPTGWDGYYYVMQVHSYLTYGHLQSPDSSLIYPYLILISGVAGDAIVGFKAGVALLAGLLVGVVFYSLVKKETPLSWACLAAAYFAFSPLTTYFLLQFPKNALGLIFLILFFSTKNRIMMACFFMATVLTHRMTGGLLLIGSAMQLFRHVQWKWLVAGAVAVVAISFLPGILHFSDLERFSGQFQVIPQWAPYSFYKLFSLTLTWYSELELVAISVLILATLFFIIKNRKGVPFTSWVWITVGLIAIFPFFKFSAGDAGYRFFLIAPAALVLALPFRDWQPRIQWAAAAMLVVAAAFSFRSYKPANFDAPNDFYSKIVRILDNKYDHVEYPLVITHSSLAEMIIFETDFDALNWLPPEDMQPQRVLRLIKGVKYPDLRKYLDTADREKLQPIAAGYIALPEDAWQRFVAFANKENDQRVLASILKGGNPLNKRPYYLEKGKVR